MTDPNAPFQNDPLDQRLRATLRAEQAAIDASPAAAPGSSTNRSNRVRMWLPLAAAAAVLLIGGFFLFASNSPRDEAVDLGIAQQPDTDAPATPDAPDTPDTPDDPDDPDAPSPDGPGVDDNDAPEPSPIPVEATTPVPTPDLTTAVIACEVPNVPVDTDGDGEPDACAEDGDPFIYSVVEGDLLTTIAERFNVTLEAIVLANPTLDPNVLVVGQTLVIPEGDAPPAFEPAPTDLADRFEPCAVDTVQLLPYFVWDIPEDDPDGGLVAHTEPGVDAPVTRVLAPNAVVQPTGGCVILPSGTPWLELLNGQGTEWVSSNFLRASQPYCLAGEQIGSATRGGAPVQQLLGPVEGFGFELDNVAVFAETFDDDYFWFDRNAFIFAGDCFPRTGARSTVCVSPAPDEVEVRIVDLRLPEPIDAIETPTTMTRSGRVWPVPNTNGEQVLVEVDYEASFGWVVGFIRPETAQIIDGACSTHEVVADEQFDALPCRVGIEPFGGDFVVDDGDPNSDADHVHAMRLISGDACTRVVIELGTGLFGEDDRPASSFPPISSASLSPTSTRVTFTECAGGAGCGLPFAAGLGEPSRIDFGGGMAFIGVDENGSSYVEFAYGTGRAALSRLENPPRIVFDYQPGSGTNAPFGDEAILRPIGGTRLALTANQPITVEGWARPFEATGGWRVYAVDRVDQLTATEPPPPGGTVAELVADNFFMTTSWAEGWGEFSVEIPGLAPGTYVILFGETPPSGESGFVGSGQFVQVGDPDPAFVGEFIDSIEVTGLTLVID